MEHKILEVFLKNLSTKSATKNETCGLLLTKNNFSLKNPQQEQG